LLSFSFDLQCFPLSQRSLEVILGGGNGGAPPGRGAEPVLNGLDCRGGGSAGACPLGAAGGTPGADLVGDITAGPAAGPPNPPLGLG